MMVRTEDQELLAESARSVVQDRAPVSRLRAQRDAGRTHDPELWSELAELGWAGMLVAEEHGGLGMQLADVAVVMEELGRCLVQSPMVSAVMCGPLVPVDGVAEGAVVSLAWRESEDPLGIETVFREGRVTGQKLGVLDGNEARAFLVSARSLDGDVVLVRVEAEHAAVKRLRRADSRDVSDVGFSDAPGAVVAEGQDVLLDALRRGTVALSAEMLGGMSEVFGMTLAYLAERQQFGAPIGSFQVLQHRAVDAYLTIELARSAVMAAARDPSLALVSLAKTRCNDGFLDLCREAIQMHGGIGMTDEHDVGLYFKRAVVASRVLGSSSWHREQWARAHGF